MLRAMKPRMTRVGPFSGSTPTSGRWRVLIHASHAGHSSPNLPPFFLPHDGHNIVSPHITSAAEVSGVTWPDITFHHACRCPRRSPHCTQSRSVANSSLISSCLHISSLSGMIAVVATNGSFHRPPPGPASLRRAIFCGGPGPAKAGGPGPPGLPR